MRTRSMTTANNHNSSNGDDDGNRHEPPDSPKMQQRQKRRRADPATKEDRMKSIDLQQKIRIALESRQAGASTNGQPMPMKFNPSFRGHGGIPAPSRLAGLALLRWRRGHNSRWRRMTPKRRVRMQQQVLDKIEGRSSDFSSPAPAAGRSHPPRLPLFGKGGIRAPEGLSADERSAWRIAHNERWQTMTRQERLDMKLENTREVYAAREQKAQNAARAGDGIDTVAMSKKRARSPEGSDASSNSCYYDAEEFITNNEGTENLPKRKRLRLEGPEPTAAVEENLVTLTEGPEPIVAAEDSLPSGLEVLELAAPTEESLAPRVFVTPNPIVKQPFVRVVTVDSEAEFSQKMDDGDDTPVTYIDFGPNFQFSDLHIHKILLRRPSFFQSVVQITAGSPELRLPLTDIGLVRLVTSCPVLENLSIHGGIYLSDRSIAAVLAKCKYIRHLALCGADFEPNYVAGEPLHQLVGRSVAPSLTKIALKNTIVNAAMVKKLRDERPELRITYSG